MSAGARRPAPPFQLVAGDKYNLTLGVLAAFALATLKDNPHIRLNPFLKWSANAYTNVSCTPPHLCRLAYTDLVARPAAVSRVAADAKIFCRVVPSLRSGIWPSSRSE